jgi:predicted dehydrogenase
MEPVNVLLIGCGMMGARHVRGFAELERTLPGSLRLLAVCDRQVENAETVAAEAEELLGFKPAVFADVAAALTAEPSLQAADVVTDPRSHDGIVTALLVAGLDVICEKPLGLTVAHGRRMVSAAEDTERILATAENNRYDPMNRLARACLEAGLIGEPNFALQIAISRGGGIVATAWRHRLAMGGVLLDVAIHLCYMLEYLLGPLGSVCAHTQMVQQRRAGPQFDGRKVEVEVDAPDCCSAVLEFASGVQGHFTVHFAGGGEGIVKRLVLGSEGSLDAPRGRSGNTVTVQRGDESVSGDALLAELPDYRLNDIETRLFGERPASYSLQGPVTDRKLIAAEMHDFIEAVRTRRTPEADGAQGLRSVAIVYAMLESALARRPVTIQEVLDGRIHAYQDTVTSAGMV